MECEECAYFGYDEEIDEYYCSVNLDEDDMARFLSHKHKRCPYFKDGDEFSFIIDAKSLERVRKVTLKNLLLIKMEKM